MSAGTNGRGPAVAAALDSVAQATEEALDLLRKAAEQVEKAVADWVL